MAHELLFLLFGDFDLDCLLLSTNSFMSSSRTLDGEISPHASLKSLKIDCERYKDIRILSDSPLSFSIVFLASIVTIVRGLGIYSRFTNSS